MRCADVQSTEAVGRRLWVAKKKWRKDTCCGHQCVIHSRPRNRSWNTRDCHNPWRSMV